MNFYQLYWPYFFVPLLVNLPLAHIKLAYLLIIHTTHFDKYIYKPFAILILRFLQIKKRKHIPIFIAIIILFL